MESLLYFLFWAVIFYLMMSKGCGTHAHGRTTGAKQTLKQGSAELYWEPPVKDLDSVCRKHIFTEDAKSSVYQGKVYYFCSRECREVFETAPEIYLSEQALLVPQTKERSHV